LSSSFRLVKGPHQGLSQLVLVPKVNLIPLAWAGCFTAVNVQ
jgi:hypothetical protein